MLNFNLAVLLVAAIWAILIAGLLIWYFVARARRKKAALESQATTRRRTGEATSTGGVSNDGGQPNGRDATQPLNRLLQQPPSNAAGDEPFGLTTQREYERLATEPFQAPPATALGERNTSERFSWAEASQSGSKRSHSPELGPTIDLGASSSKNSEPVRRSQPATRPEAAAEPDLNAQSAASLQKATGITDKAVAPQGDDLDRTVVVSRPAQARADIGWSLILPDGDALPLTADCVVGRRPTVTEGSTPLVIADPTRTLSKSHARLRLVDDRWRVSDLGSTNGVWLMHASGLEEELEPYDEVEATTQLRLGTLEVELRAGESGGAGPGASGTGGAG